MSHRPGMLAGMPDDALARCLAENDRRSAVMAEAQQFGWGHVPGRDDAPSPARPAAGDDGACAQPDPKGDGSATYDKTT